MLHRTLLPAAYLRALPNSQLARVGAYTLKMRNNAAEGDAQDVKISALTEEASPASGDWLLGEESGGALRKFDAGNLPTNLPLLYRAGGLLSNGTDTEHDIDVTAGALRGKDDDENIELSAITKRGDATWSAGTGNGGLSSSLSALAANTWYHVHAINVGGSADVGFDTSVTAANLAADHSATAYRRLGSFLTDGTTPGNIIQFTQVGDRFIWDVPPLDQNNWSLSTTEATGTFSVPPNVSVEALVSGYSQNQDAGDVIYVYSPLITEATITGDSGPAMSGYNNDTDGSFASTIPPVGIITDTSKQLHAKMDSGTCTLDLYTISWRDFLGD